MKKFLIVVDMQKDFIDGSLGSPEAQAIVPAAAEKIRSFDGKIFATLDTHGENYLQTAEGRKLPVEHCIKGTPGWEINDEIKSALEGKDAVYTEKGTFGALELPRLIEDAAQGEDFEAEFIGLCTDICVVSNVLIVKAAFPEMKISVDSACCAGVTPGKHEAALETMRSCQIDVI